MFHFTDDGWKSILDFCNATGNARYSVLYVIQLVSQRLAEGHGGCLTAVVDSGKFLQNILSSILQFGEFMADGV